MRFSRQEYWIGLPFPSPGALPDQGGLRELNPGLLHRWQSLYRLSYEGFPSGSFGKEYACNVGNPGSIPGFGKIPRRRKWQPTPVFLLQESRGHRSLEGYSSWGRKELVMT